MLIFSQNGETVFDTTGGALYAKPWRTGPDMNVVKFSVYGLGSMGSLRLATTNTMQAAKNIIKAINIMAVLGVPAVDLDNDIDAFIDALKGKKDMYYKEVVGKYFDK